MSQFTIIRFGSAGEIAGENIAPPPESPTGSHLIGFGEFCASTDTTRFNATINNTTRQFISSIDERRRMNTQQNLRLADFVTATIDPRQINRCFGHVSVAANET